MSYDWPADCCSWEPTAQQVKALADWIDQKGAEYAYSLTSDPNAHLGAVSE